MEGRTESRSRVEENRPATERTGRRKSSRRDAETCCGTRDSQVSRVRFNARCQQGVYRFACMHVDAL